MLCIQLFETKKAEASLNKLKSPEPVCFTLNDDAIGKYAFLTTLIKEADQTAIESLPANPLSNRYDGL